MTAEQKRIWMKEKRGFLWSTRSCEHLSVPRAPDCLEMAECEGVRLVLSREPSTAERAHADAGAAAEVKDSNHEATPANDDICVRLACDDTATSLAVHVRRLGEVGFSAVVLRSGDVLRIGVGEEFCTAATAAPSAPATPKRTPRKGLAPAGAAVGSRPRVVFVAVLASGDASDPDPALREPSMTPMSIKRARVRRRAAADAGSPVAGADARVASKLQWSESLTAERLIASPDDSGEGASADSSLLRTPSTAFARRALDVTGASPAAPKRTAHAAGLAGASAEAPAVAPSPRKRARQS